MDSAPICLACLSIVASELERGSRSEIQGRLVSVTRDLWNEGLAEYALVARDRLDRTVPELN